MLPSILTAALHRGISSIFLKLGQVQNMFLTWQVTVLTNSGWLVKVTITHKAVTSPMH